MRVPKLKCFSWDKIITHVTAEQLSGKFNQTYVLEYV